MSTGKILVSDKDGNYLIKFSGDVRVNLCGSLNHHMAAIFGSTDVQHVVIDMLEAECVDSTTLGLIAKLALHCRKEYNINMQLFCQNPSILRTLSCMSFDEIIDICQEVPDIEADLHAIETVLRKQCALWHLTATRPTWCVRRQRLGNGAIWAP